MRKFKTYDFFSIVPVYISFTGFLWSFIVLSLFFYLFSLEYGYKIGLLFITYIVFIAFIAPSFWLLFYYRGRKCSKYSSFYWLSCLSLLILVLVGALFFLFSFDLEPKKIYKLVLNPNYINSSLYSSGLVVSYIGFFFTSLQLFVTQFHEQPEFSGPLSAVLYSIVFSACFKALVFLEGDSPYLILMEVPTKISFTEILVNEDIVLVCTNSTLIGHDILFFLGILFPIFVLFMGLCGFNFNKFKTKKPIN